MTYRGSNLTDEQRMDRINRDLRERMGQRRDLVAAHLEERGSKLGPDSVESLLKICNEWALSDRDIEHVFFSRESTDEASSVANRLAAAVRVDLALNLALNSDQVKCVQWLRRATTHLHGLRPLDVLKNESYDVNRILNLLGQKQ